MHGPCQHACPTINTPILLLIHTSLLIQLPHRQYTHPTVVVVIHGAGDDVAGGMNAHIPH